MSDLHSGTDCFFKRDMRAVAIYCWHHTDMSPARLERIINCPNESAFQRIWEIMAAQHHLCDRLEAIRLGNALEASYRDSQSVLLCPGDTDYPNALYVLQSPPILSVRGHIGMLNRPQIALVGSRTVHPDSERITHCIADQSMMRGLIITSGGAFGIDAFAHRRAMAHAQPTIVVSALGTETAYPRENSDIFDYAGQYGAIVSQFPNRPVAHKPNFPQRNDIIAALSCATVVVQSRARGGALYTARTAIRLNKPVWVAAMPGFDDLTIGGLQLVQQEKAKLLCCLEDFDAMIPMEDAVQKSLPFPIASQTPECPQPPVECISDTHLRILQTLGNQRLTREQLRLQTGQPDDFDESLLDLELSGTLAFVGGCYGLAPVHEKATI